VSPLDFVHSQLELSQAILTNILAQRLSAFLLREAGGSQRGGRILIGWSVAGTVAVTGKVAVWALDAGLRTWGTGWKEATL
jgi:hypothetical protein